jgi:hypothetical protein
MRFTPRTPEAAEKPSWGYPAPSPWIALLPKAALQTPPAEGWRSFPLVLRGQYFNSIPPVIEMPCHLQMTKSVDANGQTATSPAFCNFVRVE